MTKIRMSIDQLEEKISQLPRVRLAALPTPLNEVPNFSKALGGPKIYLKRDDLTGLAFGGNKTRMFEFLLANALAEGADIVIGGAAVQSNYSRQLAAACNVLNLDVELILRIVRGEQDRVIQGNLFLDLLAGAHVRIIKASPEEQKEEILRRAKELKNKGRKPFIVRMGKEKKLSPDVISYTLCFCELSRQLKQQNIDATHIYVPSSDSTQAGLELGKSILGSSIKIVGISPLQGDMSEMISEFANQASSLLGFSCSISAQDVTNTDDYVGEGYGLVTSEGIEMTKLMARCEGIFLDPVYTSKAMAGLQDHIRRGKLKKEDVVIFLHTGGNTALFAYVDQLELGELKSHLF